MKAFLLLAALGCLPAAASAAGCTESYQQCVRYKNGSVAGEGGCTVSKCPTASGGSLSWKLKDGSAVSVETDGKTGKTLVNKKPGGQVKNSTAAGMGLTCYAADEDKGEQFCVTAY
ncbi:MAG: hypothetical protein Q3966_03425 [Neisseria sp.]|nr:hypothetical protein [Neisseria sp.]